MPPESQLYPRSGIGVDGPLLVIAPAGNPAIRLDARLLDRVELIGQPTQGPLVASGLAASGGVAALAGWLPVGGGLFIGAGLAYVAFDRLMEARRRSHIKDLLLAIGDLEVALTISDGPEAARSIAERLSPYTREAPITGVAVYEDARRRLQSLMQGKPARDAYLGEGLAVGTEQVVFQGGRLEVGSVSFTIDEVREHAVRGANLPLAHGQLLQAAMGLLVVAARERAEQGENPETLAARIAEYEKWSGHGAGR